MFQILKADQMWQLDAVVDQTAFLTRTDSPTVDPTGDGWWLQGYNQPSSFQNLVQRAKQHAPPQVKSVYKTLTGRH
jgi:hypothetical protein